MVAIAHQTAQLLAEATQIAACPKGARLTQPSALRSGARMTADHSHPSYPFLMRPFVCLIEARLHFGQSQDLKGKRKELKSIKEQLRRRFGVAVAETDGHDTWQRTTLLVAVLGDGAVGDRADDVERFLESRVPDGVSVTRTLRSLEDLRD